MRDVSTSERDGWGRYARHQPKEICSELGVGAAAAVGLAGCGCRKRHGSDEPVRSDGGAGESGAEPRRHRRSRSSPPASSVTARPPTPASSPTSRPSPCRWSPGETPPQFVIFSWDGAGEVGNGLFPRFLDLAKEHGASMTFFLSGLYLLPESKKRALPPAEQPASAPPTSATSPTTHIKDDARPVRPPGLARGPRDRHPLQRPLLRRSRLRRQLDARRSGAARSTRRSPFVTEWRTNTGWTDVRPAALRLRQGTRRRPYALPARPGQPAAHRRARSAGATTPPRPAASQIWPHQEAGRVGPPAAGHPVPRPQLRGALDGLQHPRQPVEQLDQGHARELPGLAEAGHRRRTSPDSSGRTRRTAPPSSSATTSSSGTAASTWTPSRRPSSTSAGARRDVRLVSFRQFVGLARRPGPGGARQAAHARGRAGAGRRLEHVPGRKPASAGSSAGGRRPPAQRLAERRLKCGFPPARGARQDPRTAHAKLFT